MLDFSLFFNFKSISFQGQFRETARTTSKLVVLTSLFSNKNINLQHLKGITNQLLHNNKGKVHIIVCTFIVQREANSIHPFIQR